MKGIVLWILCVTLSASVWAETGSAPTLKSAYQAYQDAISAKDYKAALAAARETYTIGTTELPPDHKNIPPLTFNYGRMLAKNGLNDDAYGMLKRALDAYESSYGNDSSELIDPLMELGIIETKRDRPFGMYFDRALKIARSSAAPNDELVAKLDLEIGMALANARQRADIDHFDDALAGFTRCCGADDPRAALANFYIGKHYLQLSDAAKARDAFEAALPIFEKHHASLNVVQTHAFLADVYSQLGNDAATIEHSRAVGLIEPQTDMQRALPLIRRNPSYPVAAQRAGRTGWVQIEMTIDTDGRVVDPKVVDAENGDDFAEPALVAIRQWRYAPRFVDGKPVDTPGVRVVLTFDLDD